MMVVLSLLTTYITSESELSVLSAEAANESQWKASLRYSKRGEDLPGAGLFWNDRTACKISPVVVIKCFWENMVGSETKAMNDYAIFRKFVFLVLVSKTSPFASQTPDDNEDSFECITGAFAADQQVVFNCDWKKKNWTVSRFEIES